MKNYIFINFVALIILPFWVFSQSTEVSFKKIIDLPKKEVLSDDIIQIGKEFINTPYVGGTLEGPQEKLICRLDAFDCYTFVENVMALAYERKKNNIDINNYLNTLQKLRYRNGKIDGYSSRIHYFVEWGQIAQKNGFLKNMTPIFGIKSQKTIDFMSKNSKLYASLKDNEAEIEKIKGFEKKISAQPFYYIPKDHFVNFQSQIKNGDIIAFSSTVQGLDVNHEGFALWQNGTLKLLHASLEKKKVIVSDESVLQYLNRIKKHSGVIIYRPDF